MHDLPSQTLLQQAHARPVSGEELEVFGKKAASVYACGSCGNLNDAVVETIKHAGLSPEQVKRVVEFTNQSAYLTEFRKESSHKYIEFDGGPANPSEVLKDLNDGGGGTVFDRGISDYANPPAKTASVYDGNRRAMGLEKTAAVLSEPLERDFEAMWHVSSTEQMPYADPYQDSMAVREKLASLRDGLVSDLSMLETEYMGVGDALYGHVKQAAMGGMPLGHIIQAWQDVTPGEGFVKAAFALIGPQLVEQGVFQSYDGVVASLEKTAAEYLKPNSAHPLMHSFSDFCGTLSKMAEVRAEHKEVSDYFDRIDWFVKSAGGGVIGKAWDVAGKAGKAISGGVSKGVGRVAGETAGNLAGAAASHAPRAALLGSAYMAGDTAKDHLKYSPVGSAARAVLSHVPGTDADRYREMMIAKRYRV